MMLTSGCDEFDRDSSSSCSSNTTFVFPDEHRTGEYRVIPGRGSNSGEVDPLTHITPLRRKRK